MPKLSPFILDGQKISYAKEIDERIFDIDCSAGCNPYGFSPSVREALDSITTSDSIFYDYPHGTQLKHAIASYWAPYISLKTNQVVYCNGSIDGIYMTNKLFQQSGAAVLGVCPQFSDYVLNARLLGYKYKGIHLREDENYKFQTYRLLEAITPELSLIYIDNPNNPTGQAISLHDERMILEKAMEYDICVIIDEAYGDYFPRCESAATLLGEFDNLIVIRTFSKGLGLAGLRAGYLLTSTNLCGQFDKISNPYVIAQPSRILAQASLRDVSFLNDCCEAFAQNKMAIRNYTGKQLLMAETLDSCPILLLSHTNATVNLSTEFLRRGVKVYSGSNFETLSINSARLRIPQKNQFERLLYVIKDING